MEGNRTNKFWLITGVVLGFVAIAWLLYMMFNYRNIAFIAESNLVASRDSIQYIENANGNLTAAVKAYQFDKAEMKAAHDKETRKLMARFSNVSSVTKFTATAALDSVRSDFARPIIPDSLRRRINIPEINIPGSIGRDWFKSNYRIDNNGLQLDSVTGTIAVTTITGFKRKWFLGRQYAATDVTPSSKNVTITQVVATTTKVPDSWLDRIISFGLGALAGSQINK